MTPSPVPASVLPTLPQLLRPWAPTVAVAALMLLSACTASETSGKASGKASGTATGNATPVPVTVAGVSTTPVSPPVTVTGTFGSRDEIPLAFKIGGVVQRVLVDAGQTVHRGQILAALDLREIDAAVAKAQVGVDKARRDHARVQRLAGDSVATHVQLLDATSALEAATADLQTAQVNRDYALITAPEDGVVMTRFMNPGTTVGPGTPILVLGGTRRGRVLRVGLPDRDALRVGLGDKAVVHFDALMSKSFTGTVVLVSKAADPRTGTYAVEIALSGADALPSGLMGNASIAVKGATPGLRVPVDALLEADRDSATVYTIPATGTPIATPVRVRITRLVGDQVAIEGLAADARVIAKGAAYVTPGAQVRVITDAALDSAAVRMAGRATTGARP